MWTSGLRNARDYNRGLAAPVRWGHAAAALVRPIVGPVWGWASEPGRREWARRVLLGVALFVLLLPFDGAISGWVARHQLGGDVRRELEALQQYGQGVSSLLIALVIWIQDPARRRKLANWAAAFVGAFGVVFLLKTMVGRPRPKYDDPWFFLGPFGQYPVDRAGVRHAWEVWGGISSDLWSMPSSHTAYAAVMAVFIGSMYPKLKWVVWAVAALVGVGRVLTRAHYPTDVVAGWTIGATVATLAVNRRWGERFLEWRTNRRLAGAPPTVGPEAPPPVATGRREPAQAGSAGG